MGDRPRQRRANAWAWICLALFESTDGEAPREATSTDQSHESAHETPDDAETK